jgi:hypothetical protein
MEKTVFLPWVTPDAEQVRDELMFTLFKAGFKVLPLGPCPSDENQFKNEVNDSLSKSNCSIHIVGNLFGKTLTSQASVSYVQFQFERAKEKADAGKHAFKIFVWQPTLAGSAEPEDAQQDFINDLENNIEANMTYSNAPSTIQLTDDIRSMLTVAEKPSFDLKNADIFFINNLIDEISAADILDMLSDVTDIEKLSIKQDSDTDYAELTSQQMSKSKLAVVYFKESSDWALPFAQQIWKKVGGAASNTPILVIGDEVPDINKNKKINAPKIISIIVAGELIPLEIKFQFDKVTGV